MTAPLKRAWRAFSLLMALIPPKDEEEWKWRQF